MDGCDGFMYGCVVSVERGTAAMESLFSSAQLKLVTAQSGLLGTNWRNADYSDDVSRIYWIDSGRGAVRHHGCTYVLSPGRLHLIPARTLFSYSCDHRLYQHWIHFTATWPGGLPFFNFVEVNYEVEPPNRQAVQSMIRQLEGRLGDAGPAVEMERTGILFQLLSCFLPAGDSSRVARRRSASLRFQAILEYIDGHLSAPLTVSALARMAHLERTYFSRTFRRCLDVSPSGYVAHQRIERAKQRLWTTEEPLRAIAASLGFTDEFHFSRRFKKITGLSPRDFRRMRRGAAAFSNGNDTKLEDRPWNPR